jgi:tetratricopeptide (TPR) repeat protein
MDAETRIAAALELKSMGETSAAVRYLESVATDEWCESPDSEYLMEAADELLKIGGKEASVHAWGAIVGNESAEMEHRVDAAQHILGMGPTIAGMDAIDQVLDLAQEIGIELGIEPDEYRVDSAVKIAESGNVEAGTQALLELSKNYERSIWSRYQAARALASLGQIDEAAAAYESFTEDISGTDRHDLLGGQCGKTMIGEIAELGSVNALTNLLEVAGEYNDHWAADAINAIADTEDLNTAIVALKEATESKLPLPYQMLAISKIAALGDIGTANELLNAVTEVAVAATLSTTVEMFAEGVDAQRLEYELARAREAYVYVTTDENAWYGHNIGLESAAREIGNSITAMEKWLKTLSSADA